MWNPFRRSDPAAATPEVATPRPDETDAEFVTRLAEEHLPDGIRQTWLALLKPAVHLVRSEGSGEEVARLGGLPSLPAGVGWPVWEGHGPLSFIAELHCAELAELDTGLQLPSEGRLLFFYFDGSADGGLAAVGTWDVETLQGARVLHVPGSARAEPAAAPDGVHVYPEQPLVGRPVVTHPGWEHPDFHAALLEPGQPYDPTVDHPAEAEAFTDALYERWGEPRHQVGGYAEPIQGPVEYEVAHAAIGTDIPHSDPRLEAEAERWELLLQVSSEGDDMMWGDVGNLYWMVRPADLAAGDVEQTSFTWQCG